MADGPLEQTYTTLSRPPIIGGLTLDLRDLAITQPAADLSVSRKTLSLLRNGHAGASPEMAVRLSKAFGRTPEGWLQLQMQYDLAQISQKAEQIEVSSFVLPNTEPLAIGVAPPR